MLWQALGISQIEQVYREIRSEHEREHLAGRLLKHLDVTIRVADVDLSRIPREGPAVLVVNHPFGLLEGAALAVCLSRVRQDFKILANRALSEVPELAGSLITVDPAASARSARSNSEGIRRCLNLLSTGGLLVIFPAGEVSHFQWRQRAVTDPDWNPGVARLLGLATRRASRLVVVPAYVRGSNSLLFQAAGMVHPDLRTALLGRELLNKRGTEIEMRIGSAIAADKILEIPSDRERADYLRWRTYLLASRNPYKPHTALPLFSRRPRTPESHPLSAPISADAMTREVQALDAARRLSASGSLTAYLARAEEIPSVLAEIGRLRECTFRAVGEGTGNPRDLDRFDTHYLHLFVWNERRREVVGAYRLGGTDAVRRSHGIRGLYTATLFAYGSEFLNRIGPALELGRSFVRVEYQRAFAPLLLLWKGIGKYVAQNPHYRILFGPVSISNQYRSLSRRLMVSFLERHAALAEWAGLVSNPSPFPPERETAVDVDDLSAIVSDLEPTQTGVPVLLRQYLKLGGKLLGFRVDRQFANTLDGLILVDLTRTDRKLLERYLGKEEATQFLQSQRGSYELQ